MSALLDRLLTSSPNERREALALMGPARLRALRYEWAFWRRVNQAPPAGDWRFWLLLAGRGFGKTRTAAEFIRDRVERGLTRRIALVAKTPADARDVMVNGPGGLLTISPPWMKPVYEPSLRRITWPNGAFAIISSSNEPDQLRGPEHDLAWGDEPAAWAYAEETFSNLDLGLRAIPPGGGHAQAVLSTTPRPIKLIKTLLTDPFCAVTRGSSYENEANLDPKFFGRLLSTYEGTRLGRQELRAEMLDDAEGALWTQALIDQHRTKDYPAMRRLVVAVDPAMTSGPEADETGIVVFGTDGGTPEGAEGFVLEDVSGRMSPKGWASAAIDAYRRWEADAIVAEVNNGGDLVESNIHAIDPTVVVRKVRASRGKKVRAEPVSTLYERGRIHHVGGFPQLEDQMTSFTGAAGEDSPDRMDALVWAAAATMLDAEQLRQFGFS